MLQSSDKRRSTQDCVASKLVRLLPKTTSLSKKLVEIGATERLMPMVKRRHVAAREYDQDPV